MLVNKYIPTVFESYSIISYNRNHLLVVLEGAKRLKSLCVVAIFKLIILWWIHYREYVPNKLKEIMPRFNLWVYNFNYVNVPLKSFLSLM